MAQAAHALLSQSTRSQFTTLLDARSLTEASSDLPPAIIYLSHISDPVVISRMVFSQKVRAYAAALKESGIRPRELVLIAHTQNLESIYSFWACLLLGAIPSMFPTLTEKLDATYYMSQLSGVVRHAEAQAILTSDDFAPMMAAAVPCPVYGSADLENSAGEIAPYPADPGEIAFLQHSSGSTGLQKGVALSHQAVLNQIASYSDAIGLSEQDVIVSWLPLYHDMGLIAGFLLPLIQGIPLVLMSPFDWVSHPAMLFRAIDQYQGTLCWLPNFAYNHCARRIRQGDLEGLSLASMRAFINCSEPVIHASHAAFFERFQSLGLRESALAVSYAMAENTFAVTQTRIGQPPRLDFVDRATVESDQQAAPVSPQSPGVMVNVSCGPAIAGTEVVALDASGLVLPERAIGEIAIQSSYMLSEYYKRPDLNADLFSDGRFLTGDLGYIAGGEVYITGRKKDLMIVAGKNVFPQDIEAIVNTVAGVHPGRAVVFGVQDQRDGTEVIAVVAESEAESDDAIQGLKRGIRQAIATHSTVTATYVEIVPPQWIIKTSSGKLARSANREKWLSAK